MSNQRQHREQCKRKITEVCHQIKIKNEEDTNTNKRKCLDSAARIPRLGQSTAHCEPTVPTSKSVILEAKQEQPQKFKLLEAQHRVAVQELDAANKKYLEVRVTFFTARKAHDTHHLGKCSQSPQPVKHLPSSASDGLKLSSTTAARIPLGANNSKSTTHNNFITHTSTSTATLEATRKQELQKADQELHIARREFDDAGKKERNALYFFLKARKAHDTQLMESLMERYM
eukprot:m.9685 g.9685  ORF g.9685 m.9685 type:complete len:230 (+) comp7872_c0_seq1:100-789(+)